MLNKAVIIGLDGFPREMLKLISLGLMPNLSKYIAHEDFFDIESVPTVDSTVAWPSIMTGVNPGKHGIGAWKTWKDGKYDLVNSRDIKKETIFDYFSRFGLRSLIVNIPLTYPPKEIEGVCVSGVPAISIAQNIVYPSNKEADIRKRFPKYIVNIDRNKELKRSFELYMEHLKLMVRQRTNLFLDLIKKNKWELALIVYVAIDQISHLFWDKIDLLLKNNENNDEVISRLKDFILWLDNCLGDIISELKLSNTCVIIVSDHGFGYNHGNVAVNYLLKRGGYTCRRKKCLRTRMNLLYKKRVKHETFLDKSNKMSSSDNRGVILNDPSRFGGRIEQIDLKKSLVFTLDGCSLYVNQKKYGGIVEKKDVDSLKRQVKQYLSKIKYKNDYLFDDVHLKEEIYNGNEITRLPDIILKSEKYFFSYSWSSPIVKKPGNRIGCHKSKGIIGVISDKIDIKRKNLSVYDLFPSICNIFQIPIPEYIDGKSIFGKCENYCNYRK